LMLQIKERQQRANSIFGALEKLLNELFC